MSQIKRDAKAPRRRIFAVIDDRLWAAANPLHGTAFQFAWPGAAGPVA